MKCFFTKLMNLRAILVFTVAQNGGLNHVMFLFIFLLFVVSAFKYSIYIILVIEFGLVPSLFERPLVVIFTFVELPFVAESFD